MISPETTNDILAEISHSLARIADGLEVLNKRFEAGGDGFNVCVVEGPGTLLERMTSALEGLERR